MKKQEYSVTVLVKTEQCSTGHIYIREATWREVFQYKKSNKFRLTDQPGLVKNIGSYSLISYDEFVNFKSL